MKRNRLDLEQTRVHLALALEVVKHDRWVLGGVRDGRLRVLGEAGFERETSATVRPIYQELSHMSRRCLFDRHPVAVSSIVASRFGDDADWEFEWPSIVYAPVGLPELRPVGILIVAARAEHWYSQEEIDYVAALAVTMTAPVAALCGPLGRLTDRERNVALLLGEGLSDDEISIALRCPVEEVRRLVDIVLTRLDLRSRHDVRSMLPRPMPPPKRPRLAK